MNKLSDRILFALTLAVAVYIGIFVFLQLESISRDVEISSYDEEISLIEPEKLEITSENMEIQQVLTRRQRAA